METWSRENSKACCMKNGIIMTLLRISLETTCHGLNMSKCREPLDIKTQAAVLQSDVNRVRLVNEPTHIFEPEHLRASSPNHWSCNKVLGQAQPAKARHLTPVSKQEASTKKDAICQASSTCATPEMLHASNSTVKQEGYAECNLQQVFSRLSVCFVDAGQNRTEGITAGSTQRR
eukprot:5760169-Amphidinium_carterae.1